MQIEFPAQTARNLDRWQELAAEPELARLPYKIENDRFGRVIMSPPPLFNHTRRVAQIIRRLNELLPDGLALSETAVGTADGVKVMMRPGSGGNYAQELRSDCSPGLVRAPEICIEVLSSSNSPEEMAEKRALYFKAGASRAWICELDGQIKFYDANGLLEFSALCSGFLKQIS